MPDKIRPKIKPFEKVTYQPGLCFAEKYLSLLTAHLLTPFSAHHRLERKTKEGVEEEKKVWRLICRKANLSNGLYLTSSDSKVRFF